LPDEGDVPVPLSGGDHDHVDAPGPAGFARAALLAGVSRVGGAAEAGVVAPVAAGVAPDVIAAVRSFATAGVHLEAQGDGEFAGSPPECSFESGLDVGGTSDLESAVGAEADVETGGSDVLEKADVEEAHRSTHPSSDGSAAGFDRSSGCGTESE
jgi:hypothetical protein